MDSTDLTTPSNPATPSKGTSGIKILFIYLFILAGGAIAFYIWWKNRGDGGGDTLANKSDCQTATDIPGLPSKTLAKYFDPSGTYTDAPSCAKACQNTNKDVQAALYLSPMNKCNCYNTWDATSACYDYPWVEGQKPTSLTLLTKNKDTQCDQKTNPIKKCTVAPGPPPIDPWRDYKNSKTGKFDPERKVSLKNADECSRWCQDNSGTYYNFDILKNTCYCISQDEMDDPDTGPLTNCSGPMQGWSTGPIPPSNTNTCPKSNLSNCHGPDAITGWPTDELESLIFSKISANSTTCAFECEPKGGVAAMFDNISKYCKCYGVWDENTACTTKGAFVDGEISLWTLPYHKSFCDKNKGEGLPGCDTVGTCTAECFSTGDPHDPKDFCKTTVNHCVPPLIPTTTNLCYDTSVPCPCNCEAPGTDPGTVIGTCDGGGCTYKDKDYCKTGFHAECTWNLCTTDSQCKNDCRCVKD